jgi:hypothetical protein
MKEAWLIAAGASSTAISLLHLVVIAIGAPAYRYFGAGEALAGMAEAGSVIPGGITLLVALVFAVFAAYAFAGAQLIAGLPLMKLALAVISGIYVLRGLSALPQGLALLAAPGSFPARYFVFSAASLAVGLCYALGTRAAWGRLRKPPAAG